MCGCCMYSLYLHPSFAHTSLYCKCLCTNAPPLASIRLSITPSVRWHHWRPPSCNSYPPTQPIFSTLMGWICAKSHLPPSPPPLCFHVLYVERYTAARERREKKVLNRHYRPLYTLLTRVKPGRGVSMDVVWAYGCRIWNRYTSQLL